MWWSFAYVQLLSKMFLWNCLSLQCFGTGTPIWVGEMTSVQTMPPGFVFTSAFYNDLAKYINVCKKTKTNTQHALSKSGFGMCVFILYQIKSALVLSSVSMLKPLAVPQKSSVWYKTYGSRNQSHVGRPLNPAFSLPVFPNGKGCRWEAERIEDRWDKHKEAEERNCLWVVESGICWAKGLGVRGMRDWEGQLEAMHRSLPQRNCLEEMEGENSGGGRIQIVEGKLVAR